MLGHALTLIHTGRAPTRALLTAELGVTRATVGAVTVELQALGLIRVETRPDGPTGALGRPSHRLTVNPEGPVALAAQVHADGFRVALVGLGGQVLATMQGNMTVEEDPAQVLDAVVETGAGLLRSHGRTCVGAGLAVPSAVAEPDGIALNPLHVGWSAGAPVLPIFTKRVRRAVTCVPGGTAPACSVANDINLGALAEYRHGAGRGAQHLLVVATGQRGVGGALVLGGKLHTGSSGLAMEVGHLVVNPEGRLCHCGSRGCLDVETDPLTLLDATGRAPAPGTPLLEYAVTLLREEYSTDPAVRAAADTIIDRLGLGLAGLVNVLNPDRILLGGMHRFLLYANAERLRAVVAEQSLWGRSGSVPLDACGLAHNSLIGAAELAWQPVLDDPLAVLGG